MTQTHQLGKEWCPRLVTNGSSLTAYFNARTLIHHRVIFFSNHRTQNTQLSELGDGRWKVRKRQVRGRDKDREPELQNSDSRFILRISFFTILVLHNLEVQSAGTLLEITKAKNIGRGVFKVVS